MSGRESEIVTRSLTLFGWKERVAYPGEEVVITDRPLQIEMMQVVGEWQDVPSSVPRDDRSITSYFVQGEPVAIQITKTTEDGKTHLDFAPVLMVPFVRKRRSFPRAVKEFVRRGVVAEYVGVKQRI